MDIKQCICSKMSLKLNKSPVFNSIHNVLNTVKFKRVFIKYNTLPWTDFDCNIVLC